MSALKSINISFTEFDLNSKFFPTLNEIEGLSDSEIEKNRKDFEEELSTKRNIKNIRPISIIINRRNNRRGFKKIQKRYPTRVFVNERCFTREIDNFKGELVESVVELQNEIEEVKNKIVPNQEEIEEETEVGKSSQIDRNQSILIHEFYPGSQWKGTQQIISEDPSITPEKAFNFLNLNYESRTLSQESVSISPRTRSSTSSGFGSPTSTCSTWTATSPVPSEQNQLNVNSSLTNWLLIENLSPNVNFSTLMTLVRQHGPFEFFDLYDSQGVAVCKYFSPNDALNASRGINKCLINNKIVSTQTPSEYEMNLLFDLLL